MTDYKDFGGAQSRQFAEGETSGDILGLKCTEDGVLKVDTGAGVTGMNVNVTNSSIDVALQDQTTRNFSFYFKRLLNLVTFASGVSANDRTVDLVAGHGMTTADDLTVLEDDEPYQGSVVSVVSNTIALDNLFPYPYTVAAVAARTNRNLNVNGASTYVEFNINPLGSAIWDITNLTFLIVGATAMGDDTFGDLSALTNGILVRKKLNGVYYNIFNCKTNGDFRSALGIGEYTQKAGGGDYSFSSRHQFGGQSGFGTVVRLNGSLGEELQIVIQDDLTGLSTFYATAIGHEVEP